MSAIDKDFGAGGAQLHPRHGSPDLATSLREIADDLANMALDKVPTWDTGVSVSSDTVTLSSAGWVVAVEGTTGSSTGPKQQIQSGSPAAGQVDVSYDANGVATLTFNGTDAITECAVQLVERGSGYSRKTTKA